MANARTVLAGATPLTFDGALRISPARAAKRLVWIASVYTFSAWTAEEGGGMLYKVKSSKFTEQLFKHKTMFHSGPATNSSTKGMPVELEAVDFPMGGETIDFNIAPTGATQTGTLNATFGILYEAKGGIPPDILSGVRVRAKGSIAEYDVVAGAARQVLDALAGSDGIGNMEIPTGFKEICGMKLGVAKDDAVTAAKPSYGFVDLKGDIQLGEQEYPFPSMIPGIGTEVEGGVPSESIYYPMHIPLGGEGANIQAFANPAEA